jgi:predicted O-methyltransferase YrrM
MSHYQPYFPVQDYEIIDSQLVAELEQLPAPTVGHISPAQGEFLYHFIRLTRPSFIVETGFGVGYSACIIMMAQRSAGINPCLMSVDNCQFEQTIVAARKVSARFPGHIFVEGDSKRVLLPAIDKYLRTNEDVTLDFGIVDGGHDAETVASDLKVISSFLARDGFIWIDDYDRRIPNPGVNIAGREYARQWGFCHHYRTLDERGFMVCQRNF